MYILQYLYVCEAPFNGTEMFKVLQYNSLWLGPHLKIHTSSTIQFERDVQGPITVAGRFTSYNTYLNYHTI